MDREEMLRQVRGQMPTTVDHLMAMFDFERLDRDLYRAPITDRREEGRLFGGMVAAQALRAATLSVEVEHHPHSFHGYFMRPGQPNATLLMHVERIRDGRSFTTRRVVARQEGEAIFSMSASFHKPEPSVEYARALALDIPTPDDDYEWADSPIRAAESLSPFEMRHFAPTPADASGYIESTRRAWVRTRGDIPDDRALHACVLTFMSDMGAVLAAAIAVGETFGTVMGASLDHAVWFHRPIRMDRWTLFDLSPVSNSDSRGLVQGSFYSLDGIHGATVAQEALVRPLR